MPSTPYKICPGTTAVAVNDAAAKLGLTLASPWKRLGAVVINQFFAMVCFIVMAAVFSLTDQYTLSNDAFLFINLSTSLLLLLFYLGVQLHFIRRRGQTVGKRLMKIRPVLEATGERLTAAQYVFRRELLVYAVNSLVGLPILINAFLVLARGYNRRSLEDMLAQTIVVDAPDH
ncbi:RDD family protein [Neisseria yangbaofengii]|uniref:RDD family protein n=1 Tax=Neisseria yangbaofengii TaxID=2709396 RepID=UPI0013ED631A|nr:RDD family protein [Neisseria yangbaofengii]